MYVHCHLCNLTHYYKEALTKFWKITWESAHAWNLVIPCQFIAWGMASIFMVHLILYAIPLSIYDVMYDITTTSEGIIL